MAIAGKLIHVDADLRQDNFAHSPTNSSNLI